MYFQTGTSLLPASAQQNVLTQSPQVISVAASTDNSANGKPADFSNRGGNGLNPTLAADGTDIRISEDTPTSTAPNGSGSMAASNAITLSFTLVDGTSFSAPTVAGTITRMQAMNPNLTPAEIRNILTSTATDTAATPEEEGAGILNINAAIQQAINLQA